MEVPLQEVSTYLLTAAASPTPDTTTASVLAGRESNTLPTSLSADLAAAVMEPNPRLLLFALSLPAGAAADAAGEGCSVLSSPLSPATTGNAGRVSIGDNDERDVTT